VGSRFEVLAGSVFSLLFPIEGFNGNLFLLAIFCGGLFECLKRRNLGVVLRFRGERGVYSQLYYVKQQVKKYLI
jgi:hypothetical protein